MRVRKCHRPQTRRRRSKGASIIGDEFSTHHAAPNSFLPAHRSTEALSEEPASPLERARRALEAESIDRVAMVGAGHVRVLW